MIKEFLARSGHWRATRKRKLEENPFCEACGAEKGLQVHHVLPFAEHPELENDLDNLITLCEQSFVRRAMGFLGVKSNRCHFIIGHKGNWKTSNPHVRFDAKKKFLGIK